MELHPPWEDADAVLVHCGHKRAELKEKVLTLPSNLHSNSQLSSPTVGLDQKNKIVNTGCLNEVENKEFSHPGGSQRRVAPRKNESAEVVLAEEVRMPGKWIPVEVFQT